MMRKTRRTNGQPQSVSRILVVLWFIAVTITNHHRQGGFNHKNVLSHSWAVWNSETKVSAELMSPKSSLSGLHMAIFPLSSHDLSSEFVSQSHTFVSMTVIFDQGLPYEPMYLYPSHKGLISKYSYILRGWGHSSVHTHKKRYLIKIYMYSTGPQNLSSYKTIHTHIETIMS